MSIKSSKKGKTVFLILGETSGKSEQKFYHFTKKSKVPKILKEGISPEKEDNGFVYLWDSQLVAEHCMYAQYLRKGKRMDTALLEVTIPRSWAKSDRASYYDSELEYYHAFKMARAVPAKRVMLLRYYSHPENAELSESVSSAEN